MRLQARILGGVAALALAAGGGSIPLWAGQVQWNEIPLKDGTYRQYPATPRTDTVDIPVKANGGEIEYMVKMKEGETIVYSWRAADLKDPQKLSFEFHGHTDPPPRGPGTLIFYKKSAGANESGSLVAPFEGNHGWYLKNDTDAPVTVRLTVTGFYETVPGQIPN